MSSESPISIWFPKKVFYPGETIRGKVYLQILEPLRINAVSITFEGIEKGFLQNFYFSNTEILFGSDMKDATHKERESNYRVLDPGTHQFNFKYELPEGTPFSIDESKFCRAFYQAIVTILSPKSSQTKAFEFTVTPINPFDVVKVPTTTLDDRKKSGLTLMVTTENYQCVGDTMIVHVKVRKTQTKKYSLKEVTAKLYEKRYRKTSETRDEFSTVIAENKINMQVRENETYVDKALELKIPVSVLPDSFTKFDLFTIVHELEVILDIKWRPNLKIKIPITVYPTRYAPHKTIFESVFTRFLEDYIAARGKNDAIEATLVKILTRFPTVGGDSLITLVCDILKNAKESNSMIYALHLLEVATARVGGILVDNFATSFYDSAFKKFLRKRQNGKADPLTDNLELPDGEGADDLDLGSGDPVVEKIVSLMKKWAGLSFKWKEGPFQDLVKKGIAFHDQSSAPLNLEDDNSKDSDINDLPVDLFLKHYLKDLYRNISFFHEMNKKDDYPADIWQIMEWIYTQLEISLDQIKRLVKYFSNDKNQRLTVEILTEISDRVLQVLRKKKETEEATRVLLDEDKNLSSDEIRRPEGPSSIEKQILEAINKFLPLDGFFSKTFYLPKIKVFNGGEASGVPEDEKVLAVADLTENGSCKQAVVFGLNGIYYCNDESSKKPGRGFISYTDFAKNCKIKGSSSEISLGGDHLFFVQKSKLRSDIFVSALESLQDSLYFSANSDSGKKPSKTPSQVMTKSPSKASRDSSSSGYSGESDSEPVKESKQEIKESLGGKAATLIDLDF